MNILKFNIKINTIYLDIANKYIDKRLRSYDNNEVSQKLII